MKSWKSENEDEKQQQKVASICFEIYFEPFDLKIK